MPDKTPLVYHLGDEVQLKISVQDSGIGIPADKFELIFEHFSRLTPSYEGVYKGAGLGLYTVKRYIEAMKASIQVESTVGVGTCFIISLPLTVSDHSDREKVAYRPAKTKKVTKTEKAGASASLLIVEDNQLAAKMVLSNLNRLYSHCACDIAETGQQAIKMAQANHYDLILMDIGLPDMDGIEVTKQIRALTNPKRAQVPIVALTGHGSDPEKRKEALAAGMQEVLAKPLISVVLESLIQQYLFKTGQEAKPTITEPQESDEVIDWTNSLKQCEGDEDLLHELLSAFEIDLKIAQDRLAKAYADHDDKALREELHRVRGGVVYLSLPQLDQSLALFHEAVKAKPQNPKQLKYLYAQLQQAMKAFWKQSGK